MKKKLIAFAMAMFCLLSIITPAGTAQAADKALAANTWKRVTVTSNYYQITVPGEGYISLYTKSPSGYIRAQLLNEDKEEFVSGLSGIVFCNNSSTAVMKKIPVSAGTYYIQITDVYNYGYVKYTFTELPEPTNYCIKNAIKVSSGTAVTIYNTPDGTCRRYYKIVLSKARTIKLYQDSTWIGMYNSRGQWVNMGSQMETTNNATYSFYYRIENLPAGTYYVVLDGTFRVGFGFNAASIARWKWTIE